MKKNKLKKIMLLSSILFLAGCSTNNSVSNSTKDSKKGKKKEFSVTVKQEIPSIDSSITNDVVGWGVLKNTGEGLFRADKNGDLVPAGAVKKPVISEDGLVYTYTLRENVTWSNGDPIVAEDYVYAWQRTVDPKTASEVAYLFESVKNYEQIANGTLPPSELGVIAKSNHELQVTLNSPVPYFDSLVALPPFFPQKKEMLEKNRENYAQSSDHMLYNGPFKLTNFDGAGVDTEWSYVKNESYWDKDNVKIDKINFEVIKDDSTALNLFKDGQTDDIIITGELAQQMSNDPSFYSQDMSNTTYVEYNQEKKEYQNENLRKAISYSLDRDLLTKKILGDGSIASTGLVPKNMSFNPETNNDFVKDSGNNLKYDAKKAREHWNIAKKELGIETLSINLLTSDADSAKKVSEYMQGAIQDTLNGISVEVASVPLSVRLERGNNGDFDLILVGWGAEYNDPSVFLELFTSNNINNSGKYSNSTFDKAMKNSSTTNAGNPKARWQDLLNAEKILMDTMGVCPIYQKAEAHLRNPNVKNILPSGPEYDYKWTYVEE